jgi:thymidylate synthase (FAD)
MEAPGGVVHLGIQTNTEAGELQRIELAARTCYKSEDKMTAESSVELFIKLIERKHYAMIRFGERTVCIYNTLDWSLIREWLIKYSQLQYWRYAESTAGVYVTGNLQSWLFLYKLIYNELMIYPAGPVSEIEDLTRILFFVEEVFKSWPNFSTHALLRATKYRKSNFKYDSIKNVINFSEVGIDNIPASLQRHTFRVVTDRGISHEIVRHTSLQYAQESTRYVDPGKDGTEPLSWIPEHLRYNSVAITHLNYALTNAYHQYKYWRIPGEYSLPPEDARNFLPHCLKTEMCISGYLDKSPFGKEFNSGLSHFVDMRLDKAAHKGIQPIAREISKYINYLE